jgi:4-alpha-glucanotransferase
MNMTYQRKSGILLHPTSLPGRYGVGSFNRAAYGWIDFLHQTHQTLWQVLPLGPTGYSNSPYQSFSSCAGNPYLISLEDLVEDGLLEQHVLDQAPQFPADRVDFGALYSWKLPLLQQIAEGFLHNATTGQKEEFDTFCAEHADWLDDFALFMALKEAHQGASWNQWEVALRSRHPQALQAARRTCSANIHAHKFIQWLFFRQWTRLKAYANAHNIQIIGDLPIFVAMDSADTWANPSEFFLDNAFQPTVVAGVPPDYFSATGQLWGNPLYRWEAMAVNGYAWWLRRIKATLSLYDMVRVDHFRGFASYWAVPVKEKTAVNGRWVKGPGAKFFTVVQRELGSLPIIAEDLGEITPDVVALRHQFKLPGMKVLQFAFGTDASNQFLPHNYTHNFVVYTGTHDNNTTWGWYRQSATQKERAYFLRYARSNRRDVAWSMIELAFSSVAAMAIVPLQDLLNMGTEARMNLPGSTSGNWIWRFLQEQLTEVLSERLWVTTAIYGRDSAGYVKKDKKTDEQLGQATKTHE